jgi:hypothetical protein
MQLFSNNASSVLQAGVASNGTSIQLSPGDGARFPNPQGGDFFLATLFQRVGMTEQNWEVVLITARSGDVLTIGTRGLEGTMPFSYNAGDFIELRYTAGAVLPVRNGALTGALNEAATIPLASSSAMAIGAAGANTINVTGTATINTFDSVGAGAFRRLKFAGALTLTHNAVSMRCLSGASIVTQPGDWSEWISLGNGNWEMVSYTRATGTSLIAQTFVAGPGITINNVNGVLTFGATGGSYASTLKFS